MVPKFRAWYMPFKRKEKTPKMLYGKSSNILAFAEMFPDEYIVEQCTGIKDVNGKEIYEGDIVHFRSDCLSGLGVVRWNGAGGAWEVEDIRSRTKKRGHRIYPIYPQAKYRIDGNVHENPELGGTA
ncbi:YopX family protein [Levilactobacillus brevis]|uniref:YopX family protein n=1 Tax=Levilactobacillus brevis TaxID=1580 RepID=UPI0015C4F187|nr:YopX family protein [Levilactobacillus brevis]